MLKNKQLTLKLAKRNSWDERTWAFSLYLFKQRDHAFGFLEISEWPNSTLGEFVSRISRDLVGWSKPKRPHLRWISRNGHGRHPYCSQVVFLHFFFFGVCLSVIGICSTLILCFKFIIVASFSILWSFFVYIVLPLFLSWMLRCCITGVHNLDFLVLKRA